MRRVYQGGGAGGGARAAVAPLKAFVLPALLSAREPNELGHTGEQSIEVVHLAPLARRTSRDKLVPHQ